MPQKLCEGLSEWWTARLTMSVIEGRDKILEYWQHQLNQKWTQLERKYGRKPVRRSILLTLLYMINYKHRPRIENVDGADYPIGEELVQFRILLGILGELLRRGWNRIESLKKSKNVQTFEHKIWRDFQVLGHLRNMYSLALVSKRKRMTIFANEENRNAHMSEFDTALAEWERNYRLDEKWVNYYYNESRPHKRIRNLVKAEVEERFGFSQNLLIGFNVQMSSIIQGTLRLWKQGVERPIVSLKHEGILDMLCQKYPYSPEIDTTTASIFLKEIEYTPDGSWARSPFVKLDMIKDSIYIPIHYFLYPSNMFASAWIDHIIDKGSAAGTIGKEWGAAFERYIRTELDECHPHLNVAPSNAIIQPTIFPDIGNCLGEIGKPAIEIDVIAHSTKKLYLISCKSAGSYTESDMLKNLVFLEFHDLEKQADQDFDMAGEIEDYAKCVKQSVLFLKSKGFENLEIVPMLITATFRPLSLESVQEIYSDYRIIPSVRIVQALRLSEVQFD